MIKKVRPSLLDKQYLSVRPYQAQPINVDFGNIVVTKPWGYEYMLYNNPEIEVWKLSIMHQRATSMHCHPNKKTALVVLAGRALFSTLNESWELTPLDAMVIDSGVFHSTQGISKDGLILLEFETPPMKHDLLRLEDKYGRAQSGYEGADRMQTSNNQIRLSHSINKASINNAEIIIQAINLKQEILSNHNTDRALAVVLSGIIKSETGEILYRPPHILTLEELRDTGYCFENVSLMYLSV